VNQRRFAAAAFFSAVMAAVLALIVYTERSSAAHTVAVWVMDRPVTAGAQFAEADVRRVDIRDSGSAFNFERRTAAEFPARYTRSLSAGDILRDDDLEPLVAQSVVNLSVLGLPPVAAGDRLNLYATLPSGQEALIGRGLTVLSVNGDGVTVLVDAKDEASWIAVSSSNQPLRAARADGGRQASGAPMNSDQAISILCGPACATPDATSVPASP